MIHSIEQTLVNGADALANGQYLDADRFYASVLSRHPHHSEANFQRGVIKADNSEASQALPFFTIALQSDPNNAQYWGRYIDTLIQLDLVDEANSAVQLIISKSPENTSLNRLARRVRLLLSEPVAELDLGYPKAENILDNIKLPQALRLAQKKYEIGAITQAEHVYRDVLKRFPNNRKALNAIKRLTSEPKIKVEPFADPFSQNFDRLVKLIRETEFAFALSEIQALQKIHTRSAALFRLRGAAHAGLDELDMAIACYENAMTFDPQCARTCFNLGELWHVIGEVDTAVACFRRALILQPDLLEASFRLGNLLSSTGDLRSALDCYVRALKFNPESSTALYNCGAILMDISFDRAAPEISEVFVRLLEKGPILRPANIVAAAISLVQFEPALGLALDRLKQGALLENLEETVDTLGQIPLLTKIMAVCPVPNYSLEELFTAIRAALLARWAELELTKHGLEFCQALALQCFTNEYIYAETKFERESLKTLQLFISAQIAEGQAISPVPLMILASYVPLSSIPLSENLPSSVELRALVQRQLQEPALQKTLLHQIPVLQVISEKTSVRVRAQYEEHPYPRWVHCHMVPKAMPLSASLKRRELTVENSKVTESEAPSILIAGCGTGQTAIETAAEFENCSVQAVDLSLSSLAYAKFKANELGFDQIKFMQADILDLGKMNRKFDMIESTGVLHHMKDPMAGWQVLTDCLKPGGLMRIALYSEVARQNVIAARQEIARLGVSANPVEMKQYRQQILTRGDPKFEGISSFSDFYALSEFRDLLFHEQEHRFTLHQIRNCLAELDLNFCGFETGNATKRFKAQFGQDAALLDLDAWLEFEIENPDIFVGMYQFWCQKPI